MGDIQILNQLINSMSDAVNRLEIAIQQNRIDEFNNLRAFILDVQSRIKTELAR